jgi:energy-converting hydrogenase Eha subunit C
MKISKILLVVCLIFAVVGFADIGNSMVSGFCRAIGAVFFILTFATRVIEKAEAEEAK